MKTWKKIALGLGALTLVMVGIVVAMIGPRNVIGMLRYDQRDEGRLQVGDAAPDVELLTVDGAGKERLARSIGDRPLVLVFGSFT